MGGRRRYVKNMLNIPASRANVKEAFPQVATSKVGKGAIGKSMPKKVGIKAVHKTVFGGKLKSAVAAKGGKTSPTFTTIGTQPTRAMFGLKGK